jgi:hypothetical protein
MRSAMRSLTLPPGLKYSILARTVASMPALTFRSRTSGVFTDQFDDVVVVAHPAIMRASHGHTRGYHRLARLLPGQEAFRLVEEGAGEPGGHRGVVDKADEHQDALGHQVDRRHDVQARDQHHGQPATAVVLAGQGGADHARNRARAPPEAGGVRPEHPQERPPRGVPSQFGRHLISPPLAVWGQWCISHARTPYRVVGSVGRMTSVVVLAS